MQYLSKPKHIDRSQTLYEFLYKEATQRKMSMSQLAKEIGVHHRTLTQSYRSKPRIATMTKIASYLNVNLLDLNLLPIIKKSEERE